MEIQIQDLRFRHFKCSAQSFAVYNASNQIAFHTLMEQVFPYMFNGSPIKMYRPQYSRQFSRSSFYQKSK